MKKIINRKCIVTNERYPRDNLLRVVRSKDGSIKLDLTYTAPGRGAYLLKDIKVIELAKKKNALAKAFRCPVSSDFYDSLLIELNKKGE